MAYAFDDQYPIFTRQGIDIKRYPAIERYLKRFKSELDPQPDSWNVDEDGPWHGRKREAINGTKFRTILRIGAV